MFSWGAFSAFFLTHVILCALLFHKSLWRNLVLLEQLREHKARPLEVPSRFFEALSAPLGVHVALQGHRLNHLHFCRVVGSCGCLHLRLNGWDRRRHCWRSNYRCFEGVSRLCYRCVVDVHELVLDAEAAVVGHDYKCLLERSNKLSSGVCVAFFEETGNCENDHLGL